MNQQLQMVNCSDPIQRAVSRSYLSDFLICDYKMANKILDGFCYPHPRNHLRLWDVFANNDYPLFSLGSVKGSPKHTNHKNKKQHFC